MLIINIIIITNYNYIYNYICVFRLFVFRQMYLL